MPHYEYRVVPAPERGLKAKGFRTPEARFANALQTLMNDMGSRGWEYQRAETLPCTDTDRASAETRWRNMLVFRRQIPERSPLILQASERLDLKYPPRKQPEEPETDLPEVIRNAAKTREPAASGPPPHPVYSRPATPEDDASESEGARRMLRDNGVEDHSDVSGMSNALMRLAASRKIMKSND